MRRILMAGILSTMLTVMGAAPVAMARGYVGHGGYGHAAVGRGGYAHGGFGHGIVGQRGFGHAEYGRGDFGRGAYRGVGTGGYGYRDYGRYGYSHGYWARRPWATNGRGDAGSSVGQADFGKLSRADLPHDRPAKFVVKRQP